jgi:hypothetical protein
LKGAIHVGQMASRPDLLMSVNKYSMSKLWVLLPLDFVFGLEPVLSQAPCPLFV